jgi:hypothetical protein
MLINSKDLIAGAVFIAIGAVFTIGAMIDLRMGTAFQMGPGYFPTVIGGILIVLGILIALTAVGSAPSPYGPVSWRGLMLITLAPILFGVLVRGLGLVLSLGLVVAISTFASRRMTAPLALALTAGLTLFCIAVFSYGLGLPLRLFGPWVPI